MYIKPRIALMGVLLSLWVFGCQEVEKQGDVKDWRIISLSGAITETVFELGYGSKIVGVDVTSTFPEAVHSVPKIGHVRQLNAEGLLSLQPNLIIAEQSNFNSPALEQLKKSGIRVEFIEKPFSLEAPEILFKAIGGILGVDKEVYQKKIDNLLSEKKGLTNEIGFETAPPKVVFIYSRAQGQMMLAGKNTAADAMITAAGGINPLNQFEDFRSFSEEGLISANPDILLLFSSGSGEEVDLAKAESIPGLQETNAGKNRRLIFMDGNYLLGFGPRCLEAAAELKQRIQSAKDSNNDKG
jgi:iron complex transport system substrate-binding protein